MKTLRIILLVLFFLIAAFLIIAAFLPRKAFVEESAIINAPQKLVFQEVNNYGNWAYWSPFERLDATMAITLEGPRSGVGATMRWTSRTGSGSQKILASTPDSFISNELKLMEEDEDAARSDWKFEPVDNGTRVSWNVSIDHLKYPLERYMGLFMPKMMKSVFQKGLTDLKSLCESLPLIEGLEFLTIGAQPTISIKDSATLDMVGPKMGERYGKLMKFMTEKNIQMAGAPFTIHYSWDYNRPFIFEAGVPVQSPAKGEGEIMATEIAAGDVICAPYYGPYTGLGSLHEKLQLYLAAKHIQCVGYPWEVYITDPQSEPDTSKWLTMIYFRIK
ncbi:MAG: SRPBCC family protein [Bacteroidales bacterium]|nr:SRPBCC family protein [Bacteroidales bacterium]